LEKVKESFYWPGMKDYIQDYCRQCDRCFARKPKRQKNKAPLGSYLVGEPMERIAIDILGPLPSTKSANKVLYKYFSDSLAILVWYDNCFCPFGERICNDQDETVYTFSERTTSFRPQSNGCVERFNRTLSAMLLCIVRKSWIHGMNFFSKL
jgi:hypothetical protein